MIYRMTYKLQFDSAAETNHPSESCIAFLGLRKTFLGLRLQMSNSNTTA